MTKQQQIGSSGFTIKQLRVSTVSTVSQKTKFYGGPLHQGLMGSTDVGWLCRTVIARYILTYDVTLLPDSQSQWSL